MATLNEMRGAPQDAAPEQAPPADGGADGRATLDKMMGSLRGDDELDFDEPLFERIVDRVREALFGGDTPDGALSSETLAQLEGGEGQAGPAGQAVNAAVEATVAVMRGAEESDVEVPVAEGASAAMVAVFDVADALEAMGRPLTPEQGIQALYATLDNVQRRAVEQGIWDPEEARQVMEQLAADPEEFDREMREMDPEGAQVLEQEAMADEAPAPAPPAGGGGGATLGGLRERM